MTNKAVSKDELSLQLATVDAPFSLIGYENNFGPEDWAWQFLRLNHDYQREYSSVVKNHDPEEAHPQGAALARQKHPERKILLKEVYCRRRFGLSTWLDPHLTRLPKLERGASWFYPLSRSVDSPEDSTRQVAVEGVFSYLPVPFVGNHDRRLARKSGIVVRSFSTSDVWYAVDCSVPPLAQMKSVEMISRMHRNWIQQLGAEIQPGGNAERFSSLKASPWFDAESFDWSSAGADGADAGTLWRAIHIDVLGPLKEQIKEQQQKLNQAYLAHCASGEAQPPIRERFKHELMGPRDVDGSTLTDGHFLKALVICEQLAQRGLDEYKTVHFINEQAAPSAKGNLLPNSVRDGWVTDLAKRVKRCRGQAEAFVKGGYRWLIHAQKP